MIHTAIPIPMGFPWESHSHGNSHSHAHLYQAPQYLRLSLSDAVTVIITGLSARGHICQKCVDARPSAVGASNSIQCIYNVSVLCSDLIDSLLVLVSTVICSRQQGHRFPRQFLQNSVAQFVKFHVAIIAKYIPVPVRIVVLTDNTSKYKKFIVICSTKTHYIRP